MIAGARSVASGANPGTLSRDGTSRPGSRSQPGARRAGQRWLLRRCGLSLPQRLGMTRLPGDKGWQSAEKRSMGVKVPWFPDFTSAMELARRQTRAAGQADPVAQYFTALNKGDTRALEAVWPGEVVIYDPRAGEIRGHKQLRRFVSLNEFWLSERHARIETVASTVSGGRAVVELLAHLAGRRRGSSLAGGGRRRILRRPVGGVPHLLQPVAGRRTAPHQASGAQARTRPPR